MALPACLRHICYENDIPSHVEQDLIKIYQSPFCTKEYIQTSSSHGNISAFVLYGETSNPIHVILYSLSGNELTVLNELAGIEQVYVQYFTDTVFNLYPQVTTVNFNYLISEIDNSPYPWRLWKTSHDIAIELPQSFDTYHSKLGKQTRKHIKYYLNRLQREYGDFAFQVAETHEIDPSVIGKIIEMNRLRMTSKNIRSGFSELFEKRIIDFCRHYGLVSTVSLHGKIIAGAICYEVGNHVYLEAISHDPDFDKYNAGQVCLYLTIKHMIEKGRDAFHMLWGENEYKYRFLGVKQNLYFISIYRSQMYRLLSIPKLAKHLCSNLFIQLDYLTKKYIIKRYRQRR